MDAPAGATRCAEAAEVHPQGEAETITDTQTSLSRKTTLSFEPSYTFPNGSNRYKAELQFESILPMATGTALGRSKWQLGPALGFRFHRRHLGARPERVLRCRKQSEPRDCLRQRSALRNGTPAGSILRVDRRHHVLLLGRGKSTVPIDLGFGRAFSEHFIGSLGGWYTIESRDRSRT